MKQGLIAVVVLGLVSGCGQKSADADPAATSMEIKVAAAEGGAAPGPAPSAIAVSPQKIAYVYDFGYRLSGAVIPALQRQHADYCEKQGPQVCRIIEMRQSGDEGEYATGRLTLDVAAPRARAFGTELAKQADAAGGAEVSSAIAGEDLSKQIIDTEARLRARSLLRDRLMEVLATRKGSVAELVEAERGVAQVNEEIDAARSELAAMNGRVDYSRVNLSYNSGSPAGGGFLSPIRAVVGNLGTILGVVIAGLIAAFTVLAPLGLGFWAIRKGVRRLRRAESIPQDAAESAD